MKFNIKCTEADIELIGRLLDEQPYKVVADIARRIQAQINVQLAMAQESAAAQQKAAIDEHVKSELVKHMSPIPS